MLYLPSTTFHFNDLEHASTLLTILPSVYILTISLSSSSNPLINLPLHLSPRSPPPARRPTLHSSK